MAHGTQLLRLHLHQECVSESLEHPEQLAAADGGVCLLGVGDDARLLLGGCRGHGGLLVIILLGLRGLGDGDLRLHSLGRHLLVPGFRTYPKSS